MLDRNAISEMNQLRWQEMQAARAGNKLEQRVCDLLAGVIFIRATNGWREAARRQRLALEKDLAEAQARAERGHLRSPGGRP